MRVERERITFDKERTMDDMQRTKLSMREMEQRYQ